MNTTTINSTINYPIYPIEVPPMKMLYFSSLPNDSLQQLDELIETYVPDHALETFRDIEIFIERLNKPSNSISVVLLAAEKEELEKLQAFHHQLQQLRLVIILPNKEQETVSLGSKLHPRFLSYTFGNYSVVKTVLKKYFRNGTPANPTQAPMVTSRILKT